MNLFDFLLALGFWQWFGLIIITGMAGQTIIEVARALFRKNKP